MAFFMIALLSHGSWRTMKYSSEGNLRNIGYKILNIYFPYQILQGCGKVEKPSSLFLLFSTSSRYNCKVRYIYMQIKCLIHDNNFNIYYHAVRTHYLSQIIVVLKKSLYCLISIRALCGWYHSHCTDEKTEG